MKWPLLQSLVLAVSIALPTAVCAQSDPMKGMDTKEKPTAGKSAANKAVGTVTKTDPANGKVTIAHGPVQSLKWPAMTMNFVVRDKALLGRLAPGKKVEFQFVQQGPDYVITAAR